MESQSDKCSTFIVMRFYSAWVERDLKKELQKFYALILYFKKCSRHVEDTLKTRLDFISISSQKNV